MTLIKNVELRIKDMRLYNYLSRTVEEFSPVKNHQVGFYTCGPTVYDFVHIGNLRTFVFEDILKRTLQAVGYQVCHVANITDIDDKIINRMKEELISLDQLTDKYERAFYQDLAKLNILSAASYPRATKHIGEMISLIGTLVEKGVAYVADDGVYFSIAKFPGYGRLSQLSNRTIKAGARIAQDSYDKEQASDFALWKKAKTGEPSWDSPWGKGRPGWHIECSAMSMKYLGETIDIHAGAVDLIFPHHEDEIAQSEAASGKPFARFFVEGEHLLVDDKKMAKSSGNFYTLADIVSKGFDPIALRYLFLTAHYRAQLNFTWESLQSAQNALHKLYDMVSFWDDPKIGCAEYEQNFLNAVNEDLNTPQALAVMYQMLGSDYPGSAKARSVLKFDRILGLGLDDKIGQAKKQPLPVDVAQLIQNRELVRQEGDFAKADEIRDKLEEIGWVIEDTQSGPKWRRKR